MAIKIVIISKQEHSHGLVSLEGLRTWD